MQWGNSYKEADPLVFMERTSTVCDVVKHQRFPGLEKLTHWHMFVFVEPSPNTQPLQCGMFGIEIKSKTSEL